MLKLLGGNRIAGTRDLAIGGGANYPRSNAERRRYIEDLATRHALPRETAERLLARYGTRAEALAAAIAAGSRPLCSLPDFDDAEIRYIRKIEMVRTAADILCRRTDIALSGRMTPEVRTKIEALVANLEGDFQPKAAVRHSPLK